MGLANFTYAGKMRVPWNLTLANGITLNLPIYTGDISSATPETILWGNVYTLLPNIYSLFSVTLKSNRIYVTSGVQNVGTTYWYASLSSNSFHHIVIKHYQSISSPLEIWDNGTKLSVTIDTTSSGGNVAATFPNIYYFVGGEGLGYAAAGSDIQTPTTTNLMNRSKLLAVSLWNSRLTDSQVIEISRSYLLNLPRQISASTLIDHFSLDEIPVGRDVSYAFWRGPDSDVATPWNTATPHWSKPASYDTNTYLGALQNDNNETEKLGYNTFTIPSNINIYRMDFTHRYNSNVTLTALSFKKGSTNVSMLPLPMTYNGSQSPITFLTKTFYGPWLQSEIDGFEWWATTPTMGKDTYFNVYWLPVIFYGREGILRSSAKGSTNWIEIVNSLASPAKSIGSGPLSY